MPAESTVNFPDILGYITEVERHNIGVAQMAMAVKPRVPRAGRPFEVIMLIQNASDSAIEVTVTVTVPERDVDKKKDRFIVNSPRLVVEIRPAEVGYATLPVSTLPDTAVSKDYKVSMEINVKTDEKKPTRIRSTQGGGIFDIKALPSEKQEAIENLRELPFSTTKRASGLFRGNALEVSFGLLPGRVGKLTSLKPGWVNLWSLEDQQDDSVLLEKFAEQIRLRVLPELRRTKFFAPLKEKTHQRFAQAGYELKEAEADYITRVLTLILEYANTSETQHGALAAGHYNIEDIVSGKYDYSKPTTLPHWVSGFLRAIARDERVARVPVKAIPHFVYDDLLYDAIMHSFETLEVATGEDLGTKEEMDEYAQDILARLKRNGEIGFTHVFLPLVLGGAILFDQILVGNERLGEVLQGVRNLVKDRNSERSPENETVFGMVHNVVELTLKKYGYINK